MNKREYRDLNTLDKEKYDNIKLSKVAKELGDEWIFLVNGYSKRLKNTRDGYELYVCVDHRANATCSGVYFKNSSLRDLGIIKYNESEPSIGFDYFKDSLKIANDIKKRLLPDYKHFYGLSVAKVNERESRQGDLKNIADTISKELGVEARKQSEDEYKFYSYNPSYSMTIRYSGDELHFSELRLPLEALADISVLLKRFKGKDE